MLGRFQRVLHRGVLAGLQQQHQQQCQQLEVLGLQAARGYFNDYKAAKSSLPRKLKEMQRIAEAVQKVTSRKQQAAGAAAEAKSSKHAAAIKSAAPAQSAAAAVGQTSSSSAAAAAAATSSGPVSSPLSQVPRTPGSSSGSSSSSTTAAAAAAAGPPPETLPQQDQAKSSWVPSWLDKIMDYPRRRRAPQRPLGTASPLQSDAPAAADDSSKKDDGWAQIEQWRNMSLETYQTLIANEPDAEGVADDKPPRPSRPASKGRNMTLRARMDRGRVAHARYEQQSSLISMMDDEDKFRIKQDPLAFLKDHEAIARIAQLGKTSHSAVRDLLHCFQRRREFAELILQHREAGRPMPLTGDGDGIQDLFAKLKRKKAKREQVALVKEFRDPQNCQLKVWAGMVGNNRKCPRTELPYKHCCGSLPKKALRQ